MAYTTDWKIDSPTIGHQPIDETSTTQNHPLGTIVKATDKGDNGNGSGEFIYLQGVASTEAGSWVTIDEGATALLAADGKGAVAIAMSANVANQFGWYQIAGKAVGKAATGFADNGDVYATSTDGTVDDAVVAGDRVHGARGASALDAPATGMAEFDLNRPYVDDIAD